MYVNYLTDEYNDTLSIKNCTDNGNKVEIIIPLISIIPCGMSFMCLISLMLYTLVKPIMGKKIKL